MKKMVLLLVIIIPFVFSECGGPYYFDLYLEPDKAEIGNLREKVLLLEDTNSAGTYMRNSIAFRKHPYQVEYFLFKQWAKSPDDVISDAIILFLRNGSYFKKVIDEYSSVDPDITLKINIYSIEMLKKEKKWYASLALDLEYADKKSEKVILVHSFSRMERMKGKKVRYLPEKISTILREELIISLNKLSLKL